MFEQLSLSLGSIGLPLKTDPTSGIDHPMPGYIGVGAHQSRERPAHMAGDAGTAEHRRDISIGRHVSYGDLADLLIDLLMKSWTNHSFVFRARHVSDDKPDSS